MAHRGAAWSGRKEQREKMADKERKQDTEERRKRRQASSMPQFRRPRARDAERELNKLLDDICRYFRSGKKDDDYISRGGGSYSYNSRKQNVILKFRYGYSKEKHLAFFKEYMKQLHKRSVDRKPELFSEERIDDEGEFIREYEKRAVEKFYKIIISPESQSIDMRNYVRGVMRSFGSYLGTKLDWCASIHKDTNHIHAHVLINGVDRDGKPLPDRPFPQSFVRQVSHQLARDIATEMIGERTREEIEASRDKVYTKPRYIGDLDGRIRGLSRIRDGKRHIRTFDSGLLKRLDYLCVLGLASKTRGRLNEFDVEESFDEKLAAMSRYNGFRKAMQELRYTKAGNLSIYSGQSGTIDGEVTYLFRKSDNEDLWTNAMVVENAADGKAYYVPLWFEPRQEYLRRFVTLTARRNDKGLLRPEIRVRSPRGNV